MIMKIFPFFFAFFTPVLWCQQFIELPISHNFYAKDLFHDYNPLGVSLGGGSRAYLDKKFKSGISAINVRAVRLEAITADYRTLYDADHKSWNFDKLDLEVESMKNSGVATIIANIFYTPRYLSSCPKSKNYAYCPPTNMEAWGEYVNHIVTHLYKRYDIRFFEIGNEPSGGLFFKAPLKNFFDFYVFTAKVVKSVSNEIRVGGYADNALYLEQYNDFFKILSTSDKSEELLDFVTFHWYGDWSKNNLYNPRIIFEISKSISSSLTKNGLGKKPIFLTEWNVVAERKIKDPQQIALSYFIASQYWILQAKLEKTFLFRVTPYSETNVSLLSKGGAVNPLGYLFRDMNNIFETGTYIFRKEGEYYILISPFHNEIIVTKYNTNNLKGHHFIVDFLRKNQNCYSLKKPSIFYYFTGKAYAVDNYACNKGVLTFSISLNDFESAIIKY